MRHEHYSVSTSHKAGVLGLVFIDAGCEWEPALGAGGSGGGWEAVAGC